MTRERVAVVGSGVAGLTAAWILRSHYHTTLFEADSRPGGHAHTQYVETPGGERAFDTAFMVFNEPNYPTLVRLFGELGVRTQPSEMSLSVRCDECGLDFLAGSGLRALPDRADGVDPEVWRRTREEVRRFNGEAAGVLASDDEHTSFGEFLSTKGFSAFFIAHIAIPIVASVWSCSSRTALDYPARYLFTFLRQHGLLRGGEGVRWRTVVGGSRHYVDRVVREVDDCRLGTPVRAVTRSPREAVILDADGVESRFDRLVIATHPDQALAILRPPSGAEQDVLGAIPYQQNEAVLHTDTTVLPCRPGAWNYRSLSCEPRSDGVVMTYYLNRLQRTAGPADYLVTLNATDRIRTESVLSKTDYSHPLYTETSVRARQALSALSNQYVAFAGAYHGWGFHEDGCLSGMRAAEALGASW
ncbi:NAD(P)/FAD-dependent oxidoreductase [Nocardia sp. BMG51109]|uniref:NAD(P)/FAD-dependent oxidoreductase n=1 Tax=Nocardia sp. BMG51109 TaxID=1056816 RepID=UPI000467A514|nr:FAD-dependent oxidoreductase [Nocardia sp. BMG51109]